MSLWHETMDDLAALERDVLNFDQRMKLVEIKALLTIAQELSLIHHAGINPEYDAG